jgi:hypothetical protein
MEKMELGRIALPCPGCRRILRLDPGDGRKRTACPNCQEEIPLAGGDPLTGTAPAACHVCGSGHLYWQKDFNQKLGCLFVAVGAALVPWTYGLSLGVVALIDLGLYRLLPRVSVCYVCKARYRGVPPHADHRPYELVTAQAWEARARNWTEGLVRPAFVPGDQEGASRESHRAAD